MLSRRQILELLASSALWPLIGCDSSSPGDGDGDLCASIPTETAGPFPGDGTNGPDALALPGIVRGDIRSSIGGAAGVAEGVPLTVTLSIVAAGDCAPVSGLAVYAWQCDRDGDYSMYSAAIAAENYLRGVQVSDAAGAVTFTTIAPGCYPGRWPHIHLEIFASLDAATGGGAPIATSQLALPAGFCDQVYATAGYESSAASFAAITLVSDSVFGNDEAARQMASVAAGVATLEVAI